MKRTVSYSCRWVEEESSSANAKGQEAIQQLSLPLEKEQWSGWMAPFEDLPLRRRVFEAYSSAVPAQYHPCEESLRISHVTLDDLQLQAYALCTKFFPSPTESELESRSGIAYKAIKESCPDCGRSALLEGTTTRIAAKVLEKYKGILQLPNGDAFCSETIAQILQEKGFTGFSLSKMNDGIYSLSVSMHKLPEDINFCQHCQAANLYGEEIRNLPLTYQYDLQKIPVNNGITMYIVSREFICTFIRHTPKHYKSKLEWGMIAPLFDPPLELLRS